MSTIVVYEPTLDEIDAVHDTLATTVIPPEQVCRMCCRSDQASMAPMAGLVFIQSLAAHRSYLANKNSHIFVARVGSRFVGVVRFHFPGHSMDERTHYQESMETFYQNSSFDEDSANWGDFVNARQAGELAYCSLLASFEPAIAHQVVPNLWAGAFLRLREIYPRLTPLRMCSYVIAGATLASSSSNDPVYQNPKGNYPSLNLQCRRGLDHIGTGWGVRELSVSCDDFIRAAFPVASVNAESITVKLTMHRHLLFGNEAFEEFVNKYQKHLARLAAKRS